MGMHLFYVRVCVCSSDVHVYGGGGPLLIVMLTWEKFLEHTCDEMPLFISNLYFLVMHGRQYVYSIISYIMLYACLYGMLVRNPINFLVFCLLR